MISRNQLMTDAETKIIAMNDDGILLNRDGIVYAT